MIKVNELKGKRELKESVPVNEVMNMLEYEIDKKLLTTGLIYDNKIDVILIGEYSKEICDKLANKYEKEGNYSKVEHITSSENGEKAGLTAFTFFF